MISRDDADALMALCVRKGQRWRARAGLLDRLGLGPDHLDTEMSPESWAWAVRWLEQWPDVVRGDLKQEEMTTMAGFRKAKAEQAALKVGMYGPPGSGKTFTALLVAEGLARHTGKRIAFVDTEHGTDFYAQAVPTRKVHPEAFDFDALYTRTLTEVVGNVKGLNPSEYGVVVIDSITHLWDAAKAAYTGPKTRAGSIPMHAWSKIKAPYKDLMQFLINCPMHVFILGRQGNEFSEDEVTGEIKSVGVKMKAEGETQYEPHICLRMESSRPKKGAASIPVCFAEKDRTGTLQGKVIEWPDFEKVARPLLGLLGGSQAQVQSEDDAATRDAEAIEEQDRKKLTASLQKTKEFIARFALAKTLADVEAVSKTITPDIKRTMFKEHIEQVRTAYLAAVAEKKGVPANGHKPFVPIGPTDEQLEDQRIPCDE